MDSAMKREIHRRRRNNLGFVASRTPLPSRQNQELRVMVNNRPGKTVSNVRKNGRFGKVLKQRAQAAPRQPNVQGFNRNKGIKPSNIRDGRVTNFGPMLKGKPIKQRPQAAPRPPNMPGFNRNKGIKPSNIRAGRVTSFGPILKGKPIKKRQPNVQGFNRNKGIKPSNIRDGRVTNFGPILKGKPIKQRLPNMQGFNRNKGIKPANIRTGSVTNYRPIKQRQLTAVISKNGQFQQTMNSLKKAVRKTVECSGNREDTKTLIKSVSMIIALRG